LLSVLHASQQPNRNNSGWQQLEDLLPSILGIRDEDIFSRRTEKIQHVVIRFIEGARSTSSKIGKPIQVGA
jgi:hypothetical protein